MTIARIDLIDTGANECHPSLMSDTTLVSVGPKGRVVIPIDMRRTLGIAEGSELVAVLEQDGVLLLPRAAVKRRLRGLLAGVKVSLAKELMRDRRVSAIQETADR